MKKLLFLGALICSIGLNAQSLGYNDLGILYGSEDNNGTARYRALSGAFGALGGDLSAVEINPAGAAVFLKSEFSVTLNSRDEAINTNYYNTNNAFEDNYTNLSQAGVIFTFKNNRSSNWKRTSVGFNYTLSKDYNNYWSATGNSGFATFIYDSSYTDDGDDTNDNLYLNTDGQTFENLTSGKNNKYTFSIASQYSDDLYIGASVSTHDINFVQRVSLSEDNNDGNGNTNASDSFLRNDLFNVGTGASFSVGLISKPTDNIRLGLSYQSPTWYEFEEEFNSDEGLNYFQYSLRTPSKVTGSFAYIFDKNGLISIDYTHRDYSNTKLSPTIDFGDENQTFNTDLKAAGELRVGGEWRIKKASLRGGFHHQKSPYQDALSSDDLKGYSLGFGYNFGNVKLDLSYENSNRTDVYDFYPQYSEVNAAELDFDTSKVTATLVFNI